MDASYLKKTCTLFFAPLLFIILLIFNLHFFATYKRDRENGGQWLLRGLISHHCHRVHMSR